MSWIKDCFLLTFAVVIWIFWIGETIVFDIAIENGEKTSLGELLDILEKKIFKIDS